MTQNSSTRPSLTSKLWKPNSFLLVAIAGTSLPGQAQSDQPLAQPPKPPVVPMEQSVARALRQQCAGGPSEALSSDLSKLTLVHAVLISIGLQPEHRYPISGRVPRTYACWSRLKICRPVHTASTQCLPRYFVHVSNLVDRRYSHQYSAYWPEYENRPSLMQWLLVLLRTPYRT